MDTRTIIRDLFGLEDHPFEPVLDPRTNFDFRKNNAWLTRELNVFRITELYKYFVKVGVFDAAITRGREYLDDYGYPGAGGQFPPAFFVEGVSGTGRSSMAQVLAYLIKKRCAPVSPTLKSIRVATDHFGKLLLSIKLQIELHAKEHDIEECKTIIEAAASYIKQDDPDVGMLEQIFQNLQDCMKDAPPLIIVIEPLYFRHRDWLRRLYGMLKPLNTVLIFLSDDLKLSDIFNDLARQRSVEGLGVALGGLEQETAAEFLRIRLRSFRRSEPPFPVDDLFPFAADTLPKAFGAQNDMAVKLLIEVFRAAFNAKLQELLRTWGKAIPDAPRPEDLVVSWKHFERGYGSRISQATRKPI